MDFPDALRAIRDGQRVRRPLWTDLGGRVGLWVELARPGPCGNGMRLAEQLVMPMPGGGEASLFECSQQDVLAMDWELVPDGDPG